MLNRRHIFKTAAAALAVALTVASAPAVAGTGSVHLRFVSAGFIVGIGGGEGRLTFNGHTYPLRIGGISIGTIGASAGHAGWPRPASAQPGRHRRHIYGGRRRRRDRGRRASHPHAQLQWRHP